MMMMTLTYSPKQPGGWLTSTTKRLIMWEKNKKKKGGSASCNESPFP